MGFFRKFFIRLDLPEGNKIAAGGNGPPGPEKKVHKFYGREGATRVFEKEFTALDDMTQAQIDKPGGIAKRLPPKAYDALFDPDTIELMLNPDGKVWQERLGLGMKHICDMPESEADEFIRKIAGCLKKIVNWENPRRGSAVTNALDGKNRTAG